MIKINIIQFGARTLYEIRSDKNVTIKKTNETKEYASMSSLIEPNLNDYVECTTLVEDYNKRNKYEERVQSLLNSAGYDINRQIAIICNKDLDAEHMNEFIIMQQVRKDCKNKAHIEVYG